MFVSAVNRFGKLIFGDTVDIKISTEFIHPGLKNYRVLLRRKWELTQPNIQYFNNQSKQTHLNFRAAISQQSSALLSLALAESLAKASPAQSSSPLSSKHKLSEESSTLFLSDSTKIATRTLTDVDKKLAPEDIKKSDSQPTEEPKEDTPLMPENRTTRAKRSERVDCFADYSKSVFYANGHRCVKYNCIYVSAYLNTFKCLRVNS